MMGKKQKKIGLALGSGAARGLAHIGVLKVLEEENIPVGMISGTSIGAFIGALYSAGVTVDQMEEAALGVDWRRMAGWIDPIFPTTGLIDGRRLARFMENLLPVTTFEELRLPLAVVATDILSGESLIIRRGNLLEALRAAVAFPGIFSPVRFGDRFLVDGGLCNPVPVDVVRDLGAQVVIGVCAIPPVEKRPSETFLPTSQEERPSPKRLLELFSAERIESLVHEALGKEPPPEKGEQGERGGNGGRGKPPGIFRICAQSVAIMENEINALRLARNEIDVLVRPDLNGITLLEFHRAEEAIKAGEKAARDSLGRIRRLLGDH